ncbi:MAG: hypothetical protein IKC77_04515 [Lentisphaeria bacterium]|nr:hypothetical protein [Lentisphaeria bacterium]
MKRKRYQSGQAMIELALMLLFITFATLGMLMVCSMADYADETLLQSRFNAELASRSGKDKVSGDEYSNWQTQLMHSPYSNMNIPFNLEEKPARGINPTGTFGNHLDDPGRSVPVIEHHLDQYKKLNRYHRLDDFDSELFKSDFYDAALEDNMLAAACLTKGTPDEAGNNPLSRVLSRSGHRKAARITSSETDSYNALLRAFTKLFGVDLEDAGRKIKEAPSSSAYMPVTENTTE